MKKYLLASAVFFLASFAVFTVFNNTHAQKSPLLSSNVSSVAQTYNLISEPTQFSREIIPEAVASETTPGKPVRLTIPSISVNAAVEHIGLTKEGAVGVPEGVVNVSWFTGGPRPGQKGSAVISGHSGIWRNNNTAVFDRLPKVKVGDSIYVKDDNGTTRTFIVTGLRVYGKDEVVPEIFSSSGKARLSIITCYGTYLPGEKTYDKRFVVFAVMQ